MRKKGERDGEGSCQRRPRKGLVTHDPGRLKKLRRSGRVNGAGDSPGSDGTRRRWPRRGDTAMASRDRLRWGGKMNVEKGESRRRYQRKNLPSATFFRGTIQPPTRKIYLILDLPFFVRLCFMFGESSSGFFSFCCIEPACVLLCSQCEWFLFPGRVLCTRTAVS
jgi:hypothetical protein